MSYILDALKKSEREKTLGQVPTLESVVSDGAKKQRAGTPWWLNLIVFFVALFAVFGILKMTGLINLSKSEKVVTQQTAEPAALKKESETDLSEPAVQPLVSDPVTETSTQQLTTTDQNSGVVADEQLAANLEQLDNSQPPPDPAQELIQPVELEAETQLSGSLTEDDVLQVSNDESTAELEEKFAAQEAEELAALEQQLEVQNQLEEAQANNSNQQQMNTDQQSNPQYEEVIHDGLRNISVNVVSYSSDVRQRFVMLDLTIYKEGDQLANNAQIVEIIRTGAIVEYENKRYLLKP